MFTSQATQGYSEGLADNELESEVSSIFGVEPSIPDLPKNNDTSHLSPLEYSAMLKLYRSSGHSSSGGSRKPQPAQRLKDMTPDSGVVADNNNSNSNSNQSTSSSGNQKQITKVINNDQASSQNSLLSRYINFFALEVSRVQLTDVMFRSFTLLMLDPELFLTLQVEFCCCSWCQLDYRADRVKAKMKYESSQF